MWYSHSAYQLQGWCCGKLLGYFSFLSSLHYLFKDSPARREDYVIVTKSSQLPLKFVSHRWPENVFVSERALDIWRNIEVYVKVVQEKRIQNPGNKSFQVIKQAMRS